MLKCKVMFVLDFLDHIEIKNEHYCLDENMNTNVKLVHERVVTSMGRNLLVVMRCVPPGCSTETYFCRSGHIRMYD